MSTYNSIATIEEVLYKDKSSKFIGFGYPVNNEEEIKIKLLQIKAKHPKATHHCYGYRLGLDKNNFRINDDGEPNGTAGRQILGQIDSFGLTNCLIIVVRYFGGTKLGVSGLIAAYKETAKLTVESGNITEHKILDFYLLKCPYENINKVYHIIQQCSGQFIHQEINNNSEFTISIEQEKAEQVEKLLSEGQIKFKFIERK